MTTISIRTAQTTADYDQAHALFSEYAAALGVDLCFQGFAHELATLPGSYAPPRGCLLLAGGGEAVGCIALRSLDDADASDVGEIKRLYVKPAARGTGLGRQLAESVIEEARSIGYRQLKLDTLHTMSEARGLYARLGFRECAPYYPNPLPGVAYMALDLEGD